MTNNSWINFFRVLVMHRRGYSAGFSMEAAANAQDIIVNAMARTLFMVPLPEGHPIGLSAQAKDWISEGAT